jgi:uncharacterized protein YlxW (UPF0749 family)
MSTDTPHRASRVDGSMSLLVDMTVAALDPSYGEAAARKAGGGADVRRPDKGSRGRVPMLLTALLVLVGAVTGVAAAQVRQHADDAGTVRRSLVADIHRKTTASDQLAAQAARLRAELQQVRVQALGEGARGRSTAAQVASLELVTGGVAVHGPGLVVTLDDAPNASSGTGLARGGQVGNGRIYDRDIQEVVNSLWAVGAEAITINGQRLTAQTAIRSAGEAVLVDFRPLSPPYVLRAVGNVEAMEPAFADGPIARRFTTWTSLYGIGFQVTRSQNLQLPAAGAPDLRSATPEVHP